MAGLIAGGLVAVPVLRSEPVAAASLVTFDVRTSRDSLDAAGPRRNDPIGDWSYRIDRDLTGDPFDDPVDCEAADGADVLTGAGFPTDGTVYFPDCEWPSIRSFQPGNYDPDGAGGPSALVTQGDAADFSGGRFSGGIALDAGKYLISVVADGHKIGGTNFTVDGVAPTSVQVLLDPYPLPLVTLRARVFNDISTNGQVDYPAEAGFDMSGFTATVNDWGGEVTTDWYGNPICTEYETDAAGMQILDGDGNPIPIAGTGGVCVTDEHGDVAIPNLGPARYAMVIAPPEDDPGWIQTTTLEGGLDWDIWAMEGYTGYDTEFNVGGESVPWVNFGYVKQRAGAAPNVPDYYSDGPAGTNSITGTVARYDAYTPGTGQVPTAGTIWGGFSGGKITGPAENAMVALLDLQDGDRAVWIGEADEQGNFRIDGVRDGEYQLTLWERDILTLLDIFQVTVQDGQVLDTGVLGLTGWFARYYGHVFLDYNENGRRDPNERGVPDFGLAILRRENNPVENGQNATTTDHDGYYEFDAVYPYTMWTVLEAHSDRFRTTGVTYQASNQPSATTVRGSGVDINVLPIIGQSTRIDWGVVPITDADETTIAGTVFYDTTRNEYDPRLAAVEDWSTGVPGIALTAYHAVQQPDGTWTKGAVAGTTESETWERPGPCVARDADGAPLTDQLLFPYAPGSNCIEAPLTGIQVDPMSDGAGEFGAAVNGNFGFDGLEPGPYIVEITIPEDAYGRPLYRVEDEESVNVYAGDVYTSQNNPAPSAGGGFDLGNQMTTGLLPSEDASTQAPAAAAICVGAPRRVDIVGAHADDVDDVPGDPHNQLNAPFADAGGTPLQGQVRPGCEAKLFNVVPGRNVAPAFILYNDVPAPAHFWGYSVDDLNIDTNPRRTTFGEKRGLSYSPTGIYNWAGRLVHQVNADANGIWEALLPSMTTVNCPSPSGVCPGMYRFVGNDPGPVSRPFPGYNANYRTIAAIFQAYPGINTVADTAPTQVGASILAPGGQFNALSVCAAELDRPQLFRVNRPVVDLNDPADTREIIVTGEGFGRPEGEIRLVDLDADDVIRTLSDADVTRWTNRQIRFTVPGDVAGAPYQLEIVTAAGLRPVNTITLHVLRGRYRPRIVTVGPAARYDVDSRRTVSAIQDAIDSVGGSSGNAVVVVYPNRADETNPMGAYFENLIISNSVDLQGVGPGGTNSAGNGVAGTIVHGGNFWAAGVDTTDPFATTEPNADDWYARLDAIGGFFGDDNVADGEVIYVVSPQSNRFRSDRVGRIDGLKITGGDQRDFPGNINQIGGVSTPTNAVNATTQGGGVFLNGRTPYYHLTNNVFESNGGAYGGAIRVGTPFSGDNQNDDIVIARNRIVANGGTQLAGAIAIFNGADDYVIADNEICGNSSTEYGGGISHYGYSPGGSIHHNRIVLNSAYDEGGGVNIAGELPADPAVLSQGAGEVSVRSNVIAANLSNDDGGGLRFLQAGDFRFDVVNNMIVNNVSAHQGGGVALNDAPDVRVVHNTIAKNLTTATAVTSDGLPAPAGLSTTGHSAQLVAALEATYGAGGFDDFSNPELRGNVFSDNRAGTWAGVAGVVGISDGDAVSWDVGASDGSGVPTVETSLLDTSDVDPGSVTAGAGTLLDEDPRFVQPHTTVVEVFQWRGFQRFRSAAIVSYDLSVSPFGDYHILGADEFRPGSPAIDLNPGPGPEFDVDHDGRPSGVGFDAGADEIDGALVLGPLSAGEVFDDFERTDPDAVNNTNINYGLDPALWTGAVANNRVRIVTFQQNRRLRPMNVGSQLWNGAWSQADAQEAAITVARTPGVTLDTSGNVTSSGSVGLILRATGLSPAGALTTSSSYVSVSLDPGAGGVVVRTKRAESLTAEIRAVITTGFAPGDRLLARIDVDGNLHVLRKPAGAPWQELAVLALSGATGSGTPWIPSDPGGQIGLDMSGDFRMLRVARLDDFQGGEVL